MKGPHGFAELRRSVVGISDSVLSDRLSALVAEGLVARTMNTGPPIKVVYALTRPGHALATNAHTNGTAN